ncbi:hypothetical protein TH61_11340 [Rufibacter sp. DG15C]|uniref:T6SS amidase immunity protein Tai4 family protein n=1 Tax=Rufibacter sp. DG15C TaxID=1379909 RepID=UPI00078DF0BB|nr:T6SS amidase immunity protein Tai4 family protein [Rufibacter sp. DG15C]AMM51650.1 hypothetical protein TH61_11340 [Rufibacter sp. DG15C]
MRKDQQQLRKDYALCMCLRKTYSKETASKIQEEDITRGVLIDISDLYVLYLKLDSLAQEASNRITPSVISDHEGKSFVLLNCLNFYRSKELDKFVKALMSEY